MGGGHDSRGSSAGGTTFGGPPSNVLLEADVPIVADCATAYPERPCPAVRLGHNGLRGGATADRIRAKETAAAR